MNDIINTRQLTNFPKQKVSASEKNKAKWYANCIDYVIAAGQSANDRSETLKLYDIVHGDIPAEFYAKTLNPYNSNKEKYRRFPATMHNLDIMKDIIRRYVSEYIKGNHNFVVKCNNAEVAVAKDSKIREELLKIGQEVYAAQLKQAQQQAIDQGTPPEEIDPSTLMPDPEEFIKKFNEDYIDKFSEQGQHLINVIDDMTNADVIYPGAYYDFIVSGEVYSYRDVRGTTLIKEMVNPLEAYPIPNGNQFVEDHDMFARKMYMSYQQVLDNFDKYLDDKDKKYLGDICSRSSSLLSTGEFTFSKYRDLYPDICDKFSSVDRNLFASERTDIRNLNDMFEVWHTVWASYSKKGILTYQNQSGFIDTIIVEDGFVFDVKAGHISIEWEWEKTVYEGYRIGGRLNAIYPIKSRPVCYNRNGKLPYNGICELLPRFGKFSIPKLIVPFQVLRNIFSYHREMMIAKNKLMMLVMPKSLLGESNNDKEDVIYKMASDGILIYDDLEDSSNFKAQQIRMLNANINQYISELSQLIDAIKNDAREIVDMNAQRYGDIDRGSGKATTQEAILRGSMGSVIVVYMFDKFRERDYNADLDFSKLAWIDGLDTIYRDEDKNMTLSLDVNAHVLADYSVYCKNSAKEDEKINELKSWAFSAAQNGDLDMALAAITNDNAASIKAVINKFMDMKRKHEDDLKNMENQIEQSKIENKLKEIAAKGEEDRKTEELKYYYEMQLKSQDVDLELLKPIDDKSDKIIDSNNKKSIESDKIELEREKITTDLYNKAADRLIKMKDIESKVAIAKENKNRYDGKRQ